MNNQTTNLFLYLWCFQTFEWMEGGVGGGGGGELLNTKYVLIF